MIDQGTVVRRDPQVRRAPTGSAGLYDVLDLILDKGIVIDAFVRVSLVGIELLTVDARVVVASVDTYLRYAEGVERLQVYNRSGAKRLPDMVGKTAKGAAVSKGVNKVTEAISGDDDDEEEDGEDRGVVGALTDGVRKGVGKLIGSVTGGEDDEDEDRGRKEEARPRGRQEHGRHDHGRQGNGSGGKAPAKAGARR